MATNQLNRGESRRLMYLENKDGLIDGARARIGWVTFSKTGRTVYYRGRSLTSAGGRLVSGNFVDSDSSEKFWVSGVKRRGSNAHPAESVHVVVDDDAQEAYALARQSRPSSGDAMAAGKASKASGVIRR